MNIFLSFIGSNDSGKLLKKPDGAILTALKNQKFDEVNLLWNKGSLKEINYEEIGNYLVKEIKKRKYAQSVKLIEIPIKDVTNHNEIYLKLKYFTDSLDKSEKYFYTAAISSGTPAMQVCWILLAESGDFSETNPLHLIKVKDPKFGKSDNINIKIDTSLPKIIRLKDEVESLKKDLIPTAIISITKPGLKIGGAAIYLSPIELSYYKYFAERVINVNGDEKFSGFITSNTFLERVTEIHEELFPDLDSNRVDLINLRKKDIGLSIYTFRGNVSKLNKKLRNALENETIAKNFEICSEGRRGAKFYGIKAPKEKLIIQR